jgi:16S rRNA (adenine1518-N6/adenine1519-N6)-dimethyltransferase
MCRHEPSAPAAKPLLEKVVAAAFGQRRKMLRSSLADLSVPATVLLARAEVAPDARAEELDVAQFCALARALEQG